MYKLGKAQKSKGYERSLQVSEKNVIICCMYVYHYRGDRFGDDIKKMSLIIDIFRNEVNYTNA